MEAFHPPAKEEDIPSYVRLGKELASLVWLAWILWLSFVKVGLRWVIEMIRMLIYVALLSPVFLSVGWSYFVSPPSRVVKNIRYAEQRRNLLDIYLPEGVDMVCNSSNQYHCISSLNHQCPDDFSLSCHPHPIFALLSQTIRESKSPHSPKLKLFNIRLRRKRQLSYSYQVGHGSLDTKDGEHCSATH